MKVPVLGLLIVMVGVPEASLKAAEVYGHVAAEGSAFFHRPPFAEQQRHSASLSFELDFYHQWKNGSSFTCLPFGRVDSADSSRTHFDIRELNYLWLGDGWEVRLGLGKVFWGATEFVHLVDIINQTDDVENIDGEDKLGQPMIQVSIPRQWGVVDLFVLPYFRQRTFPGEEGRLRFPLAVDTEKTRHESSAGKRHVDFALRYSHTLGDWDFGIYHFRGTGREPTLLPELTTDGEPLLIPYYEQIDQTGLDAQGVVGDWLLKLEALYRSGQGDDFFSAVGGFEYTFVGFGGTGMDLGILSEWAFDSRGEQSPSPYEQDVMFGLRLGLNDAASTEVLAGMIQDLDSSARALRVEARRRVGANWRATLEAWFFQDLAPADPFYSLRDDDYIRFELAYYF